MNTFYLLYQQLIKRVVKLMKQQHSICLSFSQQKTLNKDDSNELRGFYDENTSPLAFEYISSLDEVMITDKLLKWNLPTLGPTLLSAHRKVLSASY